jgi:uncharacterized membrane protein YqjE
MTDANDRQSEVIAKIAFFLMIGGWLVQLIISVLVILLPENHPSEIVLLLLVGFALLSEVLALVLGVVCRQHRFGMIAMTGACTFLVLAVLLMLWTAAISRSQPQMAPTVLVRRQFTTEAE